jgi:dihydroorotate dehydrogenase (fumarate)
MINLSTEYLGLKLKNPVIVASSGLVNSTAGVIKCQQQGASAVILKSLFEEQILKEFDNHKQLSEDMHPEAYDYIKSITSDFSETAYINLIKQCKNETNIPIIASINCISPERWTTYAKQIEQSGADALELNIAFMPDNLNLSSHEIHKKYYRIVAKVKETVSIPISVKVGPFFTSFGKFAKKLIEHGADGLVLFNRFYQFDIDIDNIKISGDNKLSSSTEMHTSLRWIALLSGVLNCSFSASTGIHTAKDAVKQLLAGADTVQLCSTLYLNGYERIGVILQGIENWMKEHNYNSVSDFKGRMNRTISNFPDKYERIQYIKAIIQN